MSFTIFTPLLLLVIAGTGQTFEIKPFRTTTLSRSDGKSGENRCSPLPQCATMYWLWRNTDKIPGMAEPDVDSYMQSVNCGLLDCPKEQRIQSRDRNPLIKGRLPIQRGNFHKLANTKCKAYLRLHEYKTSSGLAKRFLREIHSRSAVFNNRGLTTYRLNNPGTCCWDIYSKPNFRGDKQHVGRKFDEAPAFQPRTARVVTC